MRNGRDDVNVTMETSYTPCRVTQGSKDTCNTTLQVTGPWRQRCCASFFPLSIADAVEENVHQKAVLVSKGSFYVSPDIPAASKCPTVQSQEGKSARAVFYLLSLQNTSKRVYITGKKIVLEMGAKI